ncbi:uncharacterized protein LOC143255421 [Tachypleus tridentatus]|uniref:uncharacterized protein LOC143255421 n=1 Tax=Tachypleus tridentatus TaxID=6853 RepID=UPI003FD4F7AF
MTATQASELLTLSIFPRSGNGNRKTVTRADMQMGEVWLSTLSIICGAELRRQFPDKPSVTPQHLGKICHGMLFTLKKLQAAPADRNRPDVKAERKDYALWFMETALRAPRVIYIDEMGFNVWTIKKLTAFT